MKLADQPAADGRLAGLWRGLCHRAQRRLGRRKRLLELFVESNGANNALKMRADMIVKMFEGHDPGPTTFSIANAVKDLRTMVATGESLGAEMLATKAALAGFEEAIAHGLGGGDGARMTVYWSQRGRSTRGEATHEIVFVLALAGDLSACASRSTSRASRPTR